MIQPGDNQQLREQLQAEADRRQQAELSAATSQEEAARLQRARDELAGRLLVGSLQLLPASHVHACLQHCLHEI